MLLEKLRVEAQSVLDELWAKKLIPFELKVHRIDSLGCDEYIIRFDDSRLRSVDVSYRAGESFERLVRSAVLVRIKRIDGPTRARASTKLRKPHAA